MRDLIRLLPLLLVYAGIVLLFGDHGMEGDEARYVMFATNLSQGFYSPEGDPNLANGPGYPLVLLPFVLADAAPIAARLLNAPMLFAALLYLYAAIRIYMDRRPALLITVLSGFYVPFFAQLHLLHSEILAILLTGGFLFHFCKAVRAETPPRSRHVLAAALFLGLLMLTKVMFGYVVTAGLLVGIAAYFVRRSARVARACRIGAAALVLCAPYLLYTWHITGKPFYWGTYGGCVLYWMTTPHEGEHGDWWANQLDQLLASGKPTLIENHRTLFEALEDLDQVTWDARLKAAAIQNIRDDPLEYVSNWFANVSRILFNCPYSYESPSLRTLFYAAPNMVILILMGHSCVSAARRRVKIPVEIAALIVFVALAFAAHSLVAVTARHSLVLVPPVVLGIAFARSTRAHPA